MEKIKVILRIRPFTTDELQRRCQEAWSVDKDIERIEAMDKNMHHHPFTFDKIFTGESSNRDLY